MNRCAATCQKISKVNGTTTQPIIFDGSTIVEDYDFTNLAIQDNTYVEGLIYLHKHPIALGVNDFYSYNLPDTDLTTSYDPITMYLSDIYTIAVNLAGLPGMSIPAGFVNNMPVGLQLIGKHFSESKLLNVAHQFQQQTDWHTKVPELFV